MMTLPSIADIIFRSYLDPLLNPNFNKINIPSKFFFTHFAEKQSGPIHDGIFIYPCQVFSTGKGNIG
jgi:hypothetical protein